MKKKLSKRMPRLCALLMALVLITGTMAGCTNQSSESADASVGDSASVTASTEDTTPVEEPEQAELDPYVFPEIGTEINGFVLQEIRDFDYVGAKIGLFEHTATGAKLMYVSNDDTNRVFTLTFNTQAVDNTGMPHVFEHSTLDGSKKYPSKALFFNLSYQTYQTYMNAMTSDRTTTYPVASLSEAQLLKLADYYTDSCFFPMIMEDESIYQEEAWRYRMESEDAPLTIEGTVYSEMRGSLTKNSRAYYNALRAGLPGSFLGNVSGGDPDFIPDMSWQDLKDFHDKFYHPSNCTAFLYGDIRNIDPFLELLDQTFSQFDKKEFTVEESDYKPLEEAVAVEVASPAEEGTNTENASIIYYNMVVGKLSAEEAMQMDALLAMLQSNSSDLTQTLQKELPTGSFSAGREVAGPEDLIMFSISNVNREDAEKFKSIVDEELAKVVTDGIPSDIVDGIMASQDIENKLTRENDDVGVNLIYSLGYNYSITGDPFFLLYAWDSAANIADWNEAGVYQKLTETYLVDQPRTALVTTYPQPGLVEEKDAALAQKLEEVKAQMSEEEIAQIVAMTKKADAEEEEGEEGANSAETLGYVKQLTAVTTDDLPEEVKEYEVRDEVVDDNVRYLEAVAAVEGIGNVNVKLDAQGIAQEDIHYMMLLRNMTDYLDTTAHTRQELESLKGLYTYDPSIGISILTDENMNVMPSLSFSFIATQDNLDTAYSLMSESIFDLKLDDEQKLLDSVSSLIASRRTGYTNSPHTMLFSHTSAAVSDDQRYSEYLSGLPYFAFLEEVKAKLTDGDSADIIARLKAVQEQLKNRTNAVVLFAGSDETIAANRKSADAFLQTLKAEPVTRVEYDLPSPAAFEGIIMESQVQYNAVVASFEDIGLPNGYTADMDVLASIVSDKFLYPLLRDQYGAYGAMHGFYNELGAYIISYRDPNVKETFEVYEQLADLIAGMELDQEELDGYIMSTYSYYAMPAGELTGALSALGAILTGGTQTDKLDFMREIKSVTPESIKAYADAYRLLYEKGVKSTAGGAAAINGNADLYDEILNPFGASASAIEFEDVTEETENADYIYAAAEEGIMLGISDTEFGVDQEATVGDLAIAIYYIGLGEKEYDAEAALSFLAEYQIADASLKTGDKLTGKIYKDMVLGLYAAAQADPSELNLDPIKDDEVITRGVLAKYLMEE